MLPYMGLTPFFSSFYPSVLLTCHRAPHILSHLFFAFSLFGPNGEGDWEATDRILTSLVFQPSKAGNLFPKICFYYFECMFGEKYVQVSAGGPWNL